MIQVIEIVHKNLVILADGRLNIIPWQRREGYAGLIEVTAELGIRVIDIIIQRTYFRSLVLGELKVVHHIDETNTR